MSTITLPCTPNKVNKINKNKNNTKTKYYDVLGILNNGSDKTLLPVRTDTPTALLLLAVLRSLQLMSGFHMGRGCCLCHFGWYPMRAWARIIRASRGMSLFSSSLRNLPPSL